MAIPFSKLKIKVYGLSDFFDFGRYQNCRVDSVVDSDPGYFVWLAKNTTTKVSTDVTEKLVENALKKDLERHFKEEVKPFMYSYNKWGYDDYDEEFDDVPY